jgi:hypothetical protein
MMSLNWARLSHPMQEGLSPAQMSRTCFLNQEEHQLMSGPSEKPRARGQQSFPKHAGLVRRMETGEGEYLLLGTLMMRSGRRLLGRW